MSYLYGGNTTSTTTWYTTNVPSSYAVPMRMVRSGRSSSGFDSGLITVDDADYDFLVGDAIQLVKRSGDAATKRGIIERYVRSDEEDVNGVMLFGYENVFWFGVWEMSE